MAERRKRGMSGTALRGGIDEVGRGPLAGPVIACALVLHRVPDGLADSKRLSPCRREELAAHIARCAVYALGAASVAEIDRLNIHRATLLAMRRAARRLPVAVSEWWVDGRYAPELEAPVRCVVGGDRQVPEIMAASIVAKVVRDRLMRRLAARHPGYGFDRHFGYPTRAHQNALMRLGPCRHHRRSFRLPGLAGPGLTSVQCVPEDIAGGEAGRGVARQGGQQQQG